MMSFASTKNGEAVSPLQVRHGCRAGTIRDTTAAFAAGYYQANLIVLPQNLTLDFVTFCIRNPSPCPLLDVTESGNPISTFLGKDCNLATDLPKYIVHKDGKSTETFDIVKEWKSDDVGIAVGCSFSFDAALMRAGIPVRHVEQDVTVPMFITKHQTHPSGPFHGPLVVSMRPIPSHLIKDATAIMTSLPKAHGKPVHIGDPRFLGIEDLSRPDFGNAVTIFDGEIPVFSACGVTTQMAVQNGAQAWKSHAPGCMLVTDLPIDAESHFS